MVPREENQHVISGGIHAFWLILLRQEEHVYFLTIMDSVHVRALLHIFCIVQMLPSAWNTSEMNQLVKLERREETSGVANFRQHLFKRAEP